MHLFTTISSSSVLRSARNRAALTLIFTNFIDFFFPLKIYRLFKLEWRHARFSDAQDNIDQSLFDPDLLQHQKMKLKYLFNFKIGNVKKKVCNTIVLKYSSDIRQIIWKRINARNQFLSIFL